LDVIWQFIVARDSTHPGEASLCESSAVYLGMINASVKVILYCLYLVQLLSLPSCEQQRLKYLEKCVNNMDTYQSSLLLKILGIIPDQFFNQLCVSFIRNFRDCKKATRIGHRGIRAEIPFAQFF
jgi:hypothetical protein